MNNSLVSVILPMYNSENTIGVAIDSILNQSYSNFELLIIDDCSTDRSIDIVEKYKDNRICLFKNDLNLGIAASLNILLQHAKGIFIARMDADDISSPLRFEKQVNYLQNNDEIDLVGSDVLAFGSQNKRWRMPQSSVEIEFHLLFYSCLMHPTVMFRAESLRESGNLYNPEMVPVEDYDLWTRSALTLKCGNIPEILLEYRLPISKSSRYLNIKEIKFREIRERYREVFLSNYLITNQNSLSERDFIEIILEILKKNSICNSKNIYNYVKYYWFEYCMNDKNGFSNYLSVDDTSFYDFFKSKYLKVILKKCLKLQL